MVLIAIVASIAAAALGVYNHFKRTDPERLAAGIRSIRQVAGVVSSVTEFANRTVNALLLIPAPNTGSTVTSVPVNRGPLRPIGARMGDLEGGVNDD